MTSKTKNHRPKVVRFYQRVITSFTLLLLFTACSTGIYGQGHNGLFGNEWINHSQTYYKIKIFQDGMYRVNAAALQQAGVNLSSINLNGLQVFHRGEEVPIHVESNAGLLSYVQFYGKKNRGEFDVHCYNNPEHHFNEKYSLYNDTAAYFLTWSTTPSTKHYSTSFANLAGYTGTNAEPYFMHTNSTVYNSNWNSGQRWQIATERLTKSTFEFGEGFGSGLAQNRSTIVPSEHPFPTGPSASATVKVYTPGVYSHELQIKSGGVVYSPASAPFIFNQYKVGKFSANIPASVVQAGGTDITVTGNAANNSDQYYVAYVDLTYPRTFDFDGKNLFAFSKKANSNTIYLDITNFNLSNASLSNNNFYLYDITNNVRHKCFFDQNNGKLVTNLPPSTVDRELVLINENNTASYQNVVGVSPVVFEDFASPVHTSTNYIIITHPSLRTNSTGGAPILEYTTYRQSAAGGGFSVESVNINELYDQFAYGIGNHPLAIRHFIHYIKANWINPEYVYIIGKGRVYKDIRTLSTSNMLIPTFGHPPSDHVLAASVISDEPTIAIGRLSAYNGDQVDLYLQKIKDVEQEQAAAQTLADRGWTKNILHLGGGKNNNEQNIIRNHLNSMKATIQGPFYGGRVESFFKTSTNPIQAAQSAYLDSLINSGVSMVTFFGHSSANSFDFNLDHPQNYNNYKKYPLIMALGCYGGTMFEASPFISEDFIFEPQAGAGVFLASAGASALSALNQFAQQFYTSISTINYNEGASKSVKQAIHNLEDTTGGGGFASLNYVTTTQMACHYMTYHGDPAYRISNSDLPDYYIDASLVSHSPEVVTVQMNTFNLEIDIYNLGRAIDTAFNIRVERIYPNGSTNLVTVQRITAPYFNSLVTIPVPVGNASALGINKFNIYVDSDLEVGESAENNNDVFQYDVAVLSDAIVPVYPYEFAIVPSTPISLKASTGNAFAVSQSYNIQIDTTEYFNSPLKKDTVITQIGGLLEWAPSLIYTDSTVYYWRVSIDSTSPSSSYSWSSSSFIYIKDEYPGWNQSHFFQFLKDDRTNLVLEEPDRTFRYINSIQEVSARTAKTSSILHPENVAIFFNGSKLDQCRCFYENGVYITVIEPGTLDFWELSGPFNNEFHGGANCDQAGRTTPTFLFKTSIPRYQDSLKHFLNDVVPAGHYVLAYTLNNAYAHTWDTSLVNAFKGNSTGLMETFLDSLVSNSSTADGLPWATFFKKGDPSYVHNVSQIGGNPNDIIFIQGSLDEVWNQGTLTSTVIGPANYWGSMHWRHDTTVNDQVSVEVFGIDINQNTRTSLIGPTTTLDTSLLNIDPATYPYLELVWNSTDVIDKTSPQLTYWRVIADMVPESALRPETFLVLDSICIQQGQPLSLEIAMENISPLDMDSMLVRFEILGTGLVAYQRLDSLHSGDTLHAYVTFPSHNLSGNTYQLLVEINPNGDQPEMHHFNNIGLAEFKVQADIINPILDVTFDGIHIMNDDIVSGTPEIVITLSDNNQYLGLDDLEDFIVLLRHPSFPNGEMILNPSTTDMQFYPADPTKLAEDNRAKIMIHPDLIADGEYTLFVSASDKSGNNSGQLSYSVDFEVINKPSISHLLNYPNPFSTSTQFVFTLTGRELPNYMKIQILTVTGKVVREITQEELGPLRIGNNRTTYAWDGKDEFGDQLANGVYLYRVITKRDGADYDMYSNRTDYMFRQGFGKMYLMR